MALMLELALAGMQAMAQIRLLIFNIKIKREKALGVNERPWRRRKVIYYIISPPWRGYPIQQNPIVGAILKQGRGVLIRVLEKGY